MIEKIEKSDRGIERILWKRSIVSSRNVDKTNTTYEPGYYITNQRVFIYEGTRRNLDSMAEEMDSISLDSLEGIKLKLGLFSSICFYAKRLNLGKIEKCSILEFSGLMRKEYIAAKVVLKENLHYDDGMWLELERDAERRYKKRLEQVWILGVFVWAALVFYFSIDNSLDGLITVGIVIMLDLLFSLLYVFLVVKRHPIGFLSPCYILYTYLVAMATFLIPFVVFFLTCVKC